MIQLQKREWLVYTYIINYIRTHGYAPSVREIAIGSGYRHYGTAGRIVKELAQWGLVNLSPEFRAARTVSLVGNIKVGVSFE